jgi:DNA-binding CsgD family transcriptional regulator
MDQIWLAFTLLGIATGTALLITLLLLRRFSPGRFPALLPIVTALLFMALAAFTGVYLRILGIPRSIPAYRLFNAAAWGYAAFAAIVFLLSHKQAQRRALLGAALGSGAAVAVLIATLGPFAAPRTLERLPAWLPDAVIFSIQILIALLAAAAGIVLLRSGANARVRPWKILLRGMGVTVLLLPAAELLDLSLVFLAGGLGYALQDGFLFALGYAAANLILLAAVISSLRVGASTGGSSLVPALARAYALTRREVEIAEMVAEGLSDRAIAERLYISPRTVDTHLRNIYRKCNIGSRLQLLRLVHSYGKLRNSE